MTVFMFWFTVSCEIKLELLHCRPQENKLYFDTFPNRRSIFYFCYTISLPLIFFYN